MKLFKKTAALIFTLLMSLSLLASCSGVPEQKKEEKTYEGTHEQIINAFYEDHKDTAAGMMVGVFDKNGTVYEGYYGYSNIAEGIKVDENTVIDWGSSTKTMVWVSVMQLWEKEMIDLERDVRDYLPEGFLKNLRYDKPVRMIDLMNHMGYDVAIMADSTSRWAEALRELSGRLEEMPADEGFPAYLPDRLASFYERAGRVQTLNGAEGTVSVIGAVSPPGGDFSEPVTQHTTRFIRCFWALDRDLANARHYPAISWRASYSEYLPETAQWWRQYDLAWKENRDVLMNVLQEEVNLQRIAKLVGPDALPESQRLTLFAAEIIKNAFLQQNSFDAVDMYCSPKKQLWMMNLLAFFVTRSQELVKGGATLYEIREIPDLDRMNRMKSEVKNDDATTMASLEQRIHAALDAIGRAQMARDNQ